MSSLPSVAVVILNWNGRKFLEQFLPSVMASSYDNLEIIVADNGSADDSVKFIEGAYPRIRILKNEKNEGFARGYNTTLKQVTADYYVLLNSDVEVQPNWIQPVIELMESDVSIAACQPKLLFYHDKKMFEYAGACGGWIDGFGYPFSRGRVFDICEQDTGQYDDVKQIFWATGAALFVRASIFNSIGGFDEYFFAHQEEIDLCWRMQHAGYKIYVVPESVVYHVGGGTLPMGNKTKVFLNFRNNLIMLTKNLPAAQALWKIPFRIGLDNLAAWKGLLSGNSVTFISILKAHLHYLKWLFFYRGKSGGQHKIKSALQGVYPGLVIWNYFIQKQRTFFEIVKNKK
ncbi:MAG: glycosyltransferase family 2 protein [Chitinophagaceae bacterium]|nr:glycosyltransferase family 2 protein [Chitinophagaceae bacterium]